MLHRAIVLRYLGFTERLNPKGSGPMKAFLASVVAVIVISAVAGLVLASIDSSSKTVYQSHHGSTRL